MPGLDGHTLDDDLSDPLDHVDRVVVGALRRAGEEQNEIGRGSSEFECRGEEVRVVRHDRRAHCHPAGLLDHRSEHERVRLEYLSGADVGAERDELVTGWQDCHDRPAADDNRRLPCGRDNGQIGGAEVSTGLEQ